MDFDPKVIETLVMKQGMDWATNIMTALAIFLIGKWLAGVAVGIVKKLLIRAKMDETLVSFLTHVLYGLAFALVAIAALSRLGIETTSLAAVLAAAGLAIGLSLQNSLSNLAAGVLIITFRPFKKGDYIEAAGTGGVVHEVSIFTTNMTTADNKQIIVPNSAIIAGNITNFSAMETRRIDFTFTVDYAEDLKKVKEVLTDIVSADSRVLRDPETVIAVSELAEKGVKIAVRPWVKSSDYWNVYFDVTEKVKTRFDRESITMHAPQAEVVALKKSAA